VGKYGESLTISFIHTKGHLVKKKKMMLALPCYKKRRRRKGGLKKRKNIYEIYMKKRKNSLYDKKIYNIYIKKIKEDRGAARRVLF